MCDDYEPATMCAVEKSQLGCLSLHVLEMPLQFVYSLALQLF